MTYNVEITGEEKELLRWFRTFDDSAKKAVIDLLYSSMPPPSEETPRLTPAEFTTRAIQALRKPGKSLGIHTVYSGFLAAMKEYYEVDSAEAVNMLKKLETQGIIEMRFAKGGSMIYLPCGMHKSPDTKIAAILSVVRDRP